MRPPESPSTRSSRFETSSLHPELEGVEWMEWTTHAGLRAFVIRHRWRGHWCGYVAIEPGHPYHGRRGDYADLPPLWVDGGTTYAGGHPVRVDIGTKSGVRSSMWWLGFTNAHRTWPSGEWGARGFEAIRFRCERLARQLAAMPPKEDA